MMRKLWALGLILIVAFVIYAQGDKSVRITGYLIDNACSEGHARDAGFAEQVKKHKTTCALMPSCEASGFAVYSAGKLYRLDEAGNKRAVDLLKNAETKMGLQVSVEGTVDGDTLHVTQITEVRVAVTTIRGPG